MIRMTIRLILAAAAFAASGSAIADNTVELTACNDTFIRGGRTHLDNGVANSLDFRYDFTAYFQFDMSELSIENVLGATLTLHKVAHVSNDSMSSGGVDVFGLSDSADNTRQNWHELEDFNPHDATKGLDFRNVGDEWKPGTGAVAESLMNLDSNREADVTETIDNTTGVFTLSGPDLVTFLNRRAHDGGLVTFVLEPTNRNGKGWGWATKEHNDATLRPTLTIKFTDGTVVPEPE